MSDDHPVYEQHPFLHQAGEQPTADAANLPPEGELRLTEIHPDWPNIIQKAYEFGLAARPKVEDAEVSSILANLRSDFWAAELAGFPDVIEQRRKAADLLERLVGERAEWVNRAKCEFDAHLDTQTRLQAAEAKLAELGAELAKADAVVVALAEKRGADALEFRDCVNRHAARQQQKASAEPTARGGK